MARGTGYILALFLIALFRVRTVNLAELATAFVGKAKPESNYKRLQRFLGEFELNYYMLATWVANLMEMPQPWVLSIDRTTWELGDCVHNILVLGVIHKLAQQHPIPIKKHSRKARNIFRYGLDHLSNSI